MFRIALLFISLTLLSAACGPVGTPKSIYTGDDPRLFTGGNNSDSAQGGVTQNYTTAGEVETFDQIRNEVTATNDKELSKSIANVVVQQNGSNFDVEITTNKKIASIPEKLIFSGSAGPDDLAEKSLPNEFYLNIRCAHTDCKTLDLRLKHFAKATFTSDKNSHTLTHGKFLGQTGILYTVTQPQVRTEADIDVENYKSNTLRSLQEMTKSELRVEQTSIVVVEGPSFSRIVAPQKIRVETPLLDTADVETSVQTVQINGLDANDIEGKLVGVDPITGALLFSMYAKDTNETIQVIIDMPAPQISQPIQQIPAPEPKPVTPIAPAKPDAPPVATPPQTPTTVTPAPQTQQQPSANETATNPPAQTAATTNALRSSQIFLVSNDTQNLPVTVAANSAFTQYEQDEETKRMVQVWLTPEPRRTPVCARGNFGRNRLTKFLRQAPLVAEHIEEVTTKLDVTPEVAYLLAWESDFLIRETFPYKQVGTDPRTKLPAQDLGPWQITTDTANYLKQLMGVNFSIHKVLNGKPTDTDDRTYLKQSTYMSAGYFKYLFNKFKKDPAIAIMAYHAGPGNASKAEAKTSAYEKFNTSLADILRFRKQTRTNCQQINYAYSFLGIRTIGQNLEKYDLTDIELSKSQAYTARLSRPNGPLPK